MDIAAFLIEKSALCRSLAASVADDHVAKMLLALAEELEARAGMSAAREDGDKSD